MNPTVSPHVNSCLPTTTVSMRAFHFVPRPRFLRGNLQSAMETLLRQVNWRLLVTDGNASAKQQIATELRTLRGQPGPLDTAKPTSARAILKGLGGHSPDIVLVRLTDLAAQHAINRDVEAAIASFGWGSIEIGTGDRLNELAKRYFADGLCVGVSKGGVAHPRSLQTKLWP